MLHAAYVRVNALIAAVAPGVLNTNLLQLRFIADEVAFLCQHRSMKLIPIVEIVEVHRVFRSRSVIGDVARTQDTRARIVIVNVTAHCSVVLFDCLSI
jgi:hypothetical protein